MIKFFAHLDLCNCICNKYQNIMNWFINLPETVQTKEVDSSYNML